MAELPSPETIDLDALAGGLSDGKIDLIVVLGPTASGKTKYAVRLAGLLSARLGRGAEIISADSRQVYEGMDIGTGKDLDEYGSVPYHLIDIVSAGSHYNVYQYQGDFSKAYSDIVGRGAIPILCGGTGLYISSVISSYDFCSNLPLSTPRPSSTISHPSASPDFSDASQSRPSISCCAASQPSGPYSETRSATALSSHTASINTSAAINSSDASNTAGSCRSFEPDTSALRPSSSCEAASPATLAGTPASATVCLTTKTVSQAHPSLHPFIIGTLVSREVRNARIDARLDARLSEGLVEEIKGLLNNGIPPSTLIAYGLEYKYVTQYILGALSYFEMRDRLAIAIHQFAKRQMTWFRGMERSGCTIHWTEV